MQPNELRQRAAVSETEAKALMESIAVENRDASEVEQAEIDRRFADADRDTAMAEKLEAVSLRIQARATPMGRVSSPIFEAGESEDDKRFRTGGFKTKGHFLHSVMRGQSSTATAEDARPLIEWRSCAQRVTEARIRAVQGLNVSSGPDGGDLIPPDFSTEIWDKSRENNDIVRLINFIPIQGNTWRRPGVAETSRANGSRLGGVRAYFENEGDDATLSRPTFAANELRLKKLMCVVAITNEAYEDIPAMEAWINREVPNELGFVLQDKIINGTGAGVPLGITQSPAVVSVAKESGQAAATVVAANVGKMWARMYAPSRKNAIWIYNQDVEPQLEQMYYGTGSNAGALVYMPPTGLSGAPYGTLKGRPVYAVEQCQTLGTVGDLILFDPTQIDAIRKASGIRSEVSMHVYFLSDQSAFRFVTRVDAQPSWSSALTPFKGSNTLSPIITLATRA